MVREIRGLLRPYGLRNSKASLGGSVARASDANVSMIKLTHSICTALRGESCVQKAKRLRERMRWYKIDRQKKEAAVL